MKILVVIITKDWLVPGCLESVQNQDYPEFDVMVHIRKPIYAVPENLMVEKYANCTENRERSRKMALASDADKFLFVDSDTILPLNAMSLLASHKLDVVGGWYKLRNEERYACGRWVEDNKFINLYQVETGVVKVDCVGMGCAMFSRKALTDIRFRHGTDMLAKTFLNGDWVDMLLGESGSLGNLLDEKGYNMYMDGNVVCEHKYEEIHAA